MVNPAFQNTVLTTFQLNTLFAFQLNTLFASGSATDQGSASNNTGATAGLNLAALFTSLNQINSTGALLNTLA